MDIVIDTSALIAVILAEPERDAIVMVTSGHALIGPGSIPWKVGNAFAAMIKQRRGGVANAQRSLEILAGIPLRYVNGDMANVLSLAAEVNAYAYDAYFLEVLTKLFEVLPTDENTSDVEKGFMEITSSLPADSKPTELVQPCQRSFHHPPIDAQAAAVGLPSPSQHRADAPLTQGAPMGLRIIGPIPLHPIRPTTRAADPTGHRGYAIHQRQQLRHIMPMGPRHPRRQRHPLGIGDYMVFATGFAAVRRIGTGVRPPPTARTEALSTTARDQSIRSAALSRFNRI
jgi:predicted nucleic acid-binding protein